MNSKAKIISEALIKFDISHEEFTPVINEKENNFVLKKTTRAKYNQLSHVERDRLIEHGKKIGQIEVLFKFQYGHFSSEKNNFSNVLILFLIFKKTIQPMVFTNSFWSYFK